MPVAGDRERAESLAARVTVAIITALPKEFVAMQAMLDGAVEHSVPGRAPSEYILGEIDSKDGGTHAVVVVRAGMGENLAATRVALLSPHFPKVESVLMVGIAGGVPDPKKIERDVRLGDIVVSNSEGVVQYDFEKETLKNGILKKDLRSPPRAPSARLLDAAADLQGLELRGEHPWEAHFKRAKKIRETRRPTSVDEFHDTADPTQVIKRFDYLNRRKGKPLVFHGLIGSANKLLKNARLRDELRDKRGVLAVEMEASGVADAAWLHNIGYFVVRGICDYCDEYKSDPWQGHAAMVAAAYSRALLERMRSSDPGPQKEDPAKKSPASEDPPNNLPKRRDFVGRVDEFGAIDAALVQGRHASLTQGGQASVYGFGGVGKTALALEYAHRHLRDYPGGVWWLAAEGKPIEALGTLWSTLRASASESVKRRLAIDLTNADEIAEAVRLALQSHVEPSLLVFDNVDAADWLAHLPGGKVRLLVTTRDEQFALGACTALGTLETDDALQLARKIAGDPSCEDDARAMGRVVLEKLDRLAVAVEMAARAVAKWRISWVEYEKLLEKEMEKVLDHQQLYSVYGRGVFAALDLSIDRCVPGSVERKLLDGTTVFAPDRVPIDWALGVAEIEVGSVDAIAARATLRGLGLVTDDEAAQTASVHRLVHKRVKDRANHSGTMLEFARRGMASVTAWLVNTTGDARRMPEIDDRRSHIDASLQEAERHGEDRYWIFIANSLATHLHYRARHEEARSLLEAALVKAERQRPAFPPATAMCLSNLARTMSHLGQSTHAYALSERAGKIDKESVATIGLDEAYAGANMIRQAEVLYDLGKPAQALNLLERVLPIYENKHGPEHPRVARVLSSMGVALRDLGRGSEALSLLKRAIAIGEKTYGLDHPNGVTDLSNLAIILRDLGRAAEARPMLEAVLVATENTFGLGHPSVAIALMNLGTVLQDLGQLEQALPLLTRALQIERTNNPAHPRVATALSNLATALHQSGKLEEALPLLEQAIKIDETNYGVDHPNVAIRIANMGSFLKDLGDLDKAALLLQRAIEIDTKNYGPEHPSVASGLSSLAQVFVVGERHSEALPLFKQALDITIRANGKEHPLVADCLHTMGAALVNLDSMSAARLIETAVQIDMLNPESTNPQNAIVRLTMLAKILRSEGKAARAKPWLQRAISIAEAAFGAQHQQVAECMFNLATLYLEDLNRPDKASDLSKRAQRMVPPTHPLLDKLLQIQKKASSGNS